MDSARILETLERAAAAGADPAPLVYRRLFELRPEFEELFVMDTDGGVRGSMLATCFDALIGVAEGAPVQRVIVSAARFSHGGYGVADADFDLMFVAIRDTIRALAAEAWTPRDDVAWSDLLRAIAAIE